MPDDLPDALPGDPLPDPAELWPALDPTPGPDAGDDPASAGWVWAALPPVERRERLRLLAQWVQWLVETHELHSRLPACWYRHPLVVEHLTALYAGWLRTYCTPNAAEARPLAEAEWLATLAGFLPRLHVAACDSGHIDPPLPRPDPEEDSRFEAWLLTSEFGTLPAAPPAGPEAIGHVPVGPAP